MLTEQERLSLNEALLEWRLRCSKRYPLACLLANVQQIADHSYFLFKADNAN